MKIKMWTMMSLLMAGGMVLQFGGCIGRFLNIALNSIPFGFGTEVGRWGAAYFTNIVPLP